ncbi:hypothetical protein QWY28_05800 [Nocardioides sp. SOB77]|uniref:EfeO-type cupredoxin-like domain-containing protein n=1 Tax=Nocardioides oceani TaxID=3058369 RepID=A0ABT8FCM7_9ACTN|nr:hypothetical protein [Nocardioides oceani]MDN4172448.1 hypothetical protein [Nocardioides oceani]
MQTTRRLAATTAVLALTLAGATACGDDEPAPESSGDPKTIEVTFEGGTVTPNGERIEVGVGQEVELVVQADESGEIHVHSTPEQSLEYGTGTTTLPITLDQPGVVEVESHDLDQVIVQLEVR